MAGVEVERKWLVTTPPREALAAASELIEQGYLTVGASGAETRLRRRAGRCTLTVKSGAGMARAEREVELSAEQFEALWPATEGARLVKRRHVLSGEDGVAIEFDVYEGALAGLMVAEVEFSDVRAALAFSAPAWFGSEVTEAPEYKNQRLALAGSCPPPPAPMSP